MRGNRGRGASLDFEVEREPGARSGRRVNGSSGGSANLRDAREAWEPIVCPDCGTDHLDTMTVRMKRTGNGIEARCATCGVIAAQFVGGVWTS